MHFPSNLSLLLCVVVGVWCEESFCGHKCFGGGVVTSRACHCDSACSVYNDCCADSEHLNGNHTAKSSSIACKRKALVVTGCSKEWTGPDFIVQSCESSREHDADPVADAPVTSERTGVTYSNYFCAICNGDAEKGRVWTLQMSCPLLDPRMDTEEEAFQYIFYNHPTGEWGYVLRDDTTRKMSFHGCALSFEVPEQHRARMRPCSSGLTSSTCAGTWKKDVIQDMCGTYTDPVFSNGTRYKNFYCAICNRVDQSAMSCGDAVGPRTNNQPEEDSNKMSFSLLLDINFSEGNLVGKATCLKGEIFDPFARRCRNIVCGIPGYVLKNGMCAQTEPPLI